MIAPAAELAASSSASAMRASQDSIAPSELALTIALEMDIATMEHASATLVGTGLDVQPAPALTIVQTLDTATTAHAIATLATLELTAPFAHAPVSAPTTASV